MGFFSVVLNDKGPLCGEWSFNCSRIFLGSDPTRPWVEQKRREETQRPALEEEEEERVKQRKGRIERRRKMNKKEIFKLAKGFRGRAKNCIRIARERVEKALQYSYRDRRNKKREMRGLWIERINAGSRQHGVRFSFASPIFWLGFLPDCFPWLRHALIRVFSSYGICKFWLV